MSRPPVEDFLATALHGTATEQQNVVGTRAVACETSLMKHGTRSVGEHTHANLPWRNGLTQASIITQTVK